jgi:hypothetical protein
LITLLAYNGLRVDEALSRDVEHRGHQRGHRVLRISRKGGRDALDPLSPPVERALDIHLGDRTSGPLFVDDKGRRMYAAQAWRLVRRLARDAALKAAGQLSPHSLRHTFATSLDDAGVPLQEIHDAMGHADPRTTRRYMATHQHSTATPPTLSPPGYAAHPPAILSASEPRLDRWSRLPLNACLDGPECLCERRSCGRRIALPRHARAAHVGTGTTCSRAAAAVWDAWRVLAPFRSAEPRDGVADGCVQVIQVVP